MGANSSTSTDLKYKVVELNNKDAEQYMGTWFEISVKSGLVREGKIESCCLGAIASYDDWVSDDIWKNEIRPKLIAANPNISQDELNKLLMTEYNKVINKFSISNYCIFKREDDNTLDWRCQIGKGEKFSDLYARFLVTFNEQMEDMTFQNFLKGLGGDYLIVELVSPTDSQNGYSVVYGGTSEYFWILSRNPEFSLTDKFKKLQETYKDQLVDSLIRDPQVYKDFLTKPIKTECKTNLDIRENKKIKK